MIDFLSSWVKNIGLAIIIVSILEMMIPNNKTKKYIKMVMGTYITFCMISPFINNKVNLDSFKLENYVETSTEINQESMDRRIEQLYIEELEKNITNKVEEKGYIVNKCKVDATIADNVQDTKINKIILNVEKNKEEKQKEKSFENKIVTGIQKIKKVDTTIDKNETVNNNEKTKLTSSQKEELKEFLKQEYEVEEKCLVIS